MNSKFKYFFLTLKKKKMYEKKKKKKKKKDRNPKKLVWLLSCLNNFNIIVNVVQYNRLSDIFEGITEFMEAAK